MENKNAVIALAGNPNTGKSTIFNYLTGLRQHTGNWAGKTVQNANGQFTWKGHPFTVYDLPGIYSILSDSAEECCAKDFICFQKPDITLVIVDATCLERNLTLALQIMELTDNVVICLNLMDEAKKKGITIDTAVLSKLLGVPVICTCARDGQGMEALKELLLKIVLKEIICMPIRTAFHDSFQNAVALISQTGTHLLPTGMRKDYFFSQVLADDACLYHALIEQEGYDDAQMAEILARGEEGRRILKEKGLSLSDIRAAKSLGFLNRSGSIAAKVIAESPQKSQKQERWLDSIVLSKVWGIPFMLCLLGIVFWITIAGANVPSAMLMNIFFHMGERLGDFLTWCAVPPWLYGILKDGVFLTVSWVVAVMLPPMAIFFPLFTILEDFGLLPRIAFNLDGMFQKANAHGKQALTMCMGFGCNAAGITACNIIEAPRERMIAMLTNNFVPCNGRFPTIIMLATVFFAGSNQLGAGVFVLAVIVLSVFITLLVSKLLGMTLLKGLPSSFTLELPPYRRPKIIQVIVRSMLDRTIFVLGRAICVAAPAGALIWLLQNMLIGDATLIDLLAKGLDPMGQMMGMSGLILAAFLLGIPANEIVMPILFMCYMQGGALMEAGSMTDMAEVLVQNGWTTVTALCTVLFSLNHFPCATTLLTIHKETGSLKWTALAFLIPTAVGIIICIGVNLLAQCLQLLL